MRLAFSKYKNFGECTEFFDGFKVNQEDFIGPVK